MKEKPYQKQQNNNNVSIQTGQQFPLTIKRLGINGEGVGYFKRKVVFVKGALPGEEVVAEVTKAGERFSEAIVRKIRKESPDRVKAPCPIYEQCGGCQLQHMNYDASLVGKQDIVAQAFSRYTKIPDQHLPIQKIIGMDNPWYYRNKSQLQTRKINKQVIAGLYKEGTHELIDLSACLVQHQQLNHVTQIVKSILADLNIPIYNERKHDGEVRTIVTRIGFETKQVQLVLITNTAELSNKELFIKEVRQKLPEVTSLMQNINDSKTSLIFGEQTYHLDGEETINERLGEFSFDLSARAFFQLNPKQTVHLYDEAKKAARLSGKEKIVDATVVLGQLVNGLQMEQVKYAVWIQLGKR